MKRSDALAPLSHDHFAGLHLSRTVQQGIKAGEAPEALAAQVCRFWADELAAHFAEEEALLMAPLAITGGAALGARMVAEHRSLEALVAALGHMPPGAGALETFATALPQHIRFEEREVFPHLEQRLPPEALNVLGAALRHEPPHAEDP